MIDKDSNWLFDQNKLMETFSSKIFIYLESGMGHLNQEDLLAIIKECDTDGDGQIDLK